MSGERFYPKEGSKITMGDCRVVHLMISSETEANIGWTACGLSTSYEYALSDLTQFAARPASENSVVDCLQCVAEVFP